ncbi:MAG TPA: hypothetical protein VGG10_15310 [Rhizomicrobium sp.]|jgi:hypothetical protein
MDPVSIAETVISIGQTIAGLFGGGAPSQNNVNEENAFQLRVNLSQMRNALGIPDSFHAGGAWGSGANAAPFAAEVSKTLGRPWTPKDIAGTAEAAQIWQQQAQALQQQVSEGLISNTGTTTTSTVTAALGSSSGILWLVGGALVLFLLVRE